jgi:hypothetical protein
MSFVFCNVPPSTTAILLDVESSGLIATLVPVTAGYASFVVEYLSTSIQF